LDDATGQLAVTDPASASSDRRPEFQSPGDPSLQSPLDVRAPEDLHPGASPDLDLRPPAETVGGKLEPLPDRWRPATERQGRDGWQAGFERDALGHRDDRRGPERERGGFGIEPGTHRDARGVERDRGPAIEPNAFRGGRGPERDRAGLGMEPRPYRDARGPERDRGHAIEPTAYSTGRGPERDRGGLGIEPSAFRNGRGPEWDRGRPGTEPSAYRNGRGPERDRGGPALEPSSFRSDLRPTLHRPDGAGFGLGPDADRRMFRPSRVSAEPGPSPDQRHAYDHASRPELERPDRKQPGQGDPLSRNSEPPAERDDDDILTAPLPVILPGATSLPRPDPVVAPRGPFEPARTSQPSARPVSVTGSVDPPPAALAEPVVPPPPGPRLMPAAAAAKLDQLNELYLTAEAIGEDALGKHFSQVSQRQQELIREFFERSKGNDDIPS